MYISFISELELLGFKNISEQEQENVKSFLASVTIIDINSEIKNLTITIRKSIKIKLPDAIIAATSQYLNLPLITSDKEIVESLSSLPVIYYER